MKTILAIFKRDFKKIFTNAMAIILAVGIALLPSLYAWFNIFANWDPYGATGNMQVAVIIEDEGYRYRDIEINVGEKIRENLEANDAIDWQFLDKEEAMSGIEAGKYYAGIEIPAGFSQSLTSIVTNNFVQPSITYYANEKKNAIATKITDKVVQTVQQEVNESFVSTVISVVGSLINVIADSTQDGAVTMLTDLQSKIDIANTTIGNVKETVDGFENVMKVSQTLNDAINTNNLNGMVSNSGALVQSGTEMATMLQSSIDGITNTADTSLDKAATGLTDTANTLNNLSDYTADQAAAPLADALEKALHYKAQLEAVRDALENVKATLAPEGDTLDKMIAKVNAAIARTDNIISTLTSLQDGVVQSEVEAVTDDMLSLAGDINDARTDYQTNVQPVINQNLTALIDMLTVTGKLITELNGELPTLESLAGSLDSTTQSGANMVAGIDKLLTDTQKQLTTLSDNIAGLEDSEIINTLQNVAGKDADQLGAFLACPVTVDTDKVYGIENYGSAMAPFYSTLAIWVGSMILIAVVKTKIKNKKEIGDIRMHHAYFGRMLTFLLFSVTQATIICLGDLCFLGIQCYHPVKFMLAGILAAVAFTIFIYSITFAFGDVGKAIGIIFLVVQIGGSGGTFPIDVTPQFFRAINPYLPFTFVIEAMRECICGTYGNDYWIDLLKLLAYIVIGLVIGLGVKFVIKKPVRFFEKRVEDTGLF